MAKAKFVVDLTIGPSLRRLLAAGCPAAVEALGEARKQLRAAESALMRANVLTSRILVRLLRSAATSTRTLEAPRGRGRRGRARRVRTS